MESVKKAEKFWDRAAGFYDKEEKKDRQSYMNFIETASKYLKAGAIILDFGCGTGLVCNEIAGKVEHIVAVDISSKMLEAARNKALERKILNIDYIRASISDERLKSSSFDAIIAFNVLHLLENSRYAIQRCFELLKPGGFIISATPCMGEKPLLNSLFSVGSKLGITPSIIPFKFTGLEQLFTEAQFEIIETGALKPNSPQYVAVGKKGGELVK